MNLLRNWLIGKARTAPLFEENDLRVETIIRNSMTKLKRNNEFDTLMIDVVEQGLLDDDWEGFVYLMHWNEIDSIIPLYIGKAERKGVLQPLSFNIKNIRTNQHAFGRWGYSLAYHIGNLSHAIFQEPQGYKKPEKKYKRWSKALFGSLSPPTLKEKVYVSLISCRKGMKGMSGLSGSVASIEKEIISIGSTLPDNLLLNVDGR